LSNLFLRFFAVFFFILAIYPSVAHRFIFWYTCQVIKHLLFDLDNTLYPCSSAIDQAVTDRMVRFVANFLGISREEAAQKRRERISRYGTTLEWLQTEYGFTENDAFLTAAHPESELAEVRFDPNLRAFLQSLNMPMSVLTNSPRIHADRILRYLQVDDLFLDVYDIIRNNFRGKPHPGAFLTALAGSGYTIAETLFADDYVKYIVGYEKLGGKSVLVNPDPAEWYRLPQVPHIATIYDLPGILKSLA
jgi:putative hydrolase of the HAD superfamily